LSCGDERVRLSGETLEHPTRSRRLETFDERETSDDLEASLVASRERLLARASSA
jgi:hypothetical protein